MRQKPNFKEAIKELPFLILMILIIFVSFIFVMDLGEENPNIDFDQWSEFVIWALGLWFAQLSLSGFTIKNETTEEKG